jgi:hypothetical protein
MTMIVRKPVKVSYMTGLSSRVKVTICNAIVTAARTFGCSGKIAKPSSAGALGVHKIVAKGLTP